MNNFHVGDSMGSIVSSILGILTNFDTNLREPGL